MSVHATLLLVPDGVLRVLWRLSEPVLVADMGTKPPPHAVGKERSGENGVAGDFSGQSILDGVDHVRPLP